MSLIRIEIYKIKFLKDLNVILGVHKWYNKALIYIYIYIYHISHKHTSSDFYYKEVKLKLYSILITITLNIKTIHQQEGKKQISSLNEYDNHDLKKIACQLTKSGTQTVNLPSRSPKSNLTT